ncbi:hypothetical protein GJV26_22415 [Massilia dura]|uniref:Uncharacterized protein n=1 Tax=Pseudoduganella dura TaxID=321982 RepID=A0A6I3XFL8_9BURK|nr:hypothetical protein [Pseudoduganella dura]MUI15199.1 hypothetical protein [Pseudoduganella dura]
MNGDALRGDETWKAAGRRQVRRARPVTLVMQVMQVMQAKGCGMAFSLEVCRKTRCTSHPGRIHKSNAPCSTDATLAVTGETLAASTRTTVNANAVPAF